MYTPVNFVLRYKSGVRCDGVKVKWACQLMDMSQMSRHFAYAKTDADQLRGDREADQRLYFRYKNIKIPLLP